MTEAPAPARIYVGRQQDFLNNARQLVKHGVRNIAVVLHDGHFYAFDNACYHHGGALLRGDIEDMGGHPCIVCPWHSYRITMDTGEGLYVGIEIDPAALGKPRQAVKSKGKKQRVYPVTVDADGAVYIEYDTSGPRVESDTYANMAIANQEEATEVPISSNSGGGGGAGRGPRLHSGLGIELRSGHVFQAMHAGGQLGHGVAAGSSLPGGKRPSVSLLATSANGTQLTLEPTYSLDTMISEEDGPRDVGPKLSKVHTVSCRQVTEVCREVKQFSFVLRGGGAECRAWLPGQYVELELPIRTSDGQPVRRRWTLCTVDHEDNSSDFTLLVKRAGSNTAVSGSAWLHQYALHASLRLLSVGGTLTMAHHAQRIRAVRGQVIWLTAGIGITSAYANVMAAFDRGTAKVEGGCLAAGEPLRVVHLHVDRCMDGVAKLRELKELSQRLASDNGHDERQRRDSSLGGASASAPCSSHTAATRSYTLQLFLTKDVAPQQTTSPSPSLCTEPARLATAGTEVPCEVVAVQWGRRLGFEDIAAAANSALRDSAGGFLSFVCGPPSFVETCTSSLISLGVDERDILTDDP